MNHWKENLAQKASSKRLVEQQKVDSFVNIEPDFEPNFEPDFEPDREIDDYQSDSSDSLSTNSFVSPNILSSG